MIVKLAWLGVYQRKKFRNGYNVGKKTPHNGVYRIYKIAQKNKSKIVAFLMKWNYKILIDRRKTVGFWDISMIIPTTEHKEKLLKNLRKCLPIYMN